MQSGSESVNPAKFSEAKQSLITPVMDKDGRMYSGLIYQQPDVSSCTVGRKYVYLRNCNGDIARYVIKEDKIII